VFSLLAKLKGPLNSLSASGRLTAGLTFLRRRFTNIVEREPQPKDTKSFAQLEWRHMYQKAVALWNALDAVEKLSWESLARPFHITGFAYFISQALKPNPGLYLPLQGGKMAGDIDMEKNRLLKLPLPTDDQEAASKKYHDDNLPPGGYTEGARVYHNANQSAPYNTYTILNFNSETYDTDNIHDNIVNNSRLTCRTAGVYIITLSLDITDTAVGYREAWFVCNSRDYFAGVTSNADIGTEVYQALSAIYRLNVDDFIEAEVYQNSGLPAIYGYWEHYSPYFAMQRIG